MLDLKTTLHNMREYLKTNCGYAAEEPELAQALSIMARNRVVLLEALEMCFDETPEIRAYLNAREIEWKAR